MTSFSTPSRDLQREVKRQRDADTVIHETDCDAVLKSFVGVG